ncbi:MAG: hypothetical protein ACE5IZ_10475 [Dehalococcoidia bacterium]
MINSKQLTQKERTIGDAAVDGLFRGIIAGALMAAYLVAVGLAAGEGPGTVLARFAPGEGASPLVGALLHLAVSGVYGMLFGLGWHLITRRWPFGRLRAGSFGGLPAWVGGLVYVVALLILTEVVILPGTDSPLREVPFVHFALAHIIYGMTLGFLISRGREG